ncbi:MAG: murein L,D-transpeptidase [Verrucomicrobia bacterium]|nr:MAG: murein L,D-transpeptidase [Verrucomicrobiota bacterium]
MLALHRQLPVVLLAALAGCVTFSRYEELPAAALDLPPPKPITTALPSVAVAQPQRALPLADLIMGRAPPPPAAFPSLGKPPAGGFQALEKENRGTRDAGRVSTKTPPPPAPRPFSLEPRPANLAPLSFRQIIALQTLLDRRNFSCNCADGRVGFRTHAALRAFQAAHDLPVTGDPDVATVVALDDLGSAFTTYTVTDDDHAQLTQNPTTWLAKSQVARLGYPTILEAIAERGHAAQQAIRDLNPQVNTWPDPPAGTTLTIPDVDKNEKLPRAARIRISIGGKLIRVFDGADKLVAQFPCSIARDPQKREPCEISVAVVAPNPNYTFDPALFSEDPESASIPTKLIIPPGPRNPVGVAWVGLSKSGYGMHGTPKPEDIGKTESHGCFRLSNWNALKLLHMVEIGTPVSVEE